MPPDRDPAASARYAIYFRPPDDAPLTMRCDAWLGRDPAGGGCVDAPPVAGLDPARWRRWVADPRRYGFHATLKPPFRLAEGRTADELASAVAAFARTRSPIRLPAPVLGRIGHFLALALPGGDGAVRDLAADCVDAFDGFRRPPDAAELARRRARPLSPRQEALLERWGYPYVIDEFRFHMTLTGALAAGELDIAETCLSAWLADMPSAPLEIRDLCLFVEDTAGAPFRVLSRHAFAGTPT